MAGLENELYCGIGYLGAPNVMGITVLEIYENSPAAQSDLRVGDIITAVLDSQGGGWNETGTLTPNGGTGNTRGTPGTSVDLLITRDAENEAGQRRSQILHTGWIQREVILSDPELEIDVDSSHECGLIGSLTPPAHIDFASLNSALTPRTI